MKFEYHINNYYYYLRYLSPPNASNFSQISPTYQSTYCKKKTNKRLIQNCFYICRPPTQSAVVGTGRQIVGGSVNDGRVEFWLLSHGYLRDRSLKLKLHQHREIRTIFTFFVYIASKMFEKSLVFLPLCRSSFCWSYLFGVEHHFIHIRMHSNFYSDVTVNGDPRSAMVNGRWWMAVNMIQFSWAFSKKYNGRTSWVSDVKAYTVFVLQVPFLSANRVVFWSFCALRNMGQG